jgi:N-acetylglucosaminyl-diphospho-decaprenol L-rhamnosyltransferase
MPDAGIVVLTHGAGGEYRPLVESLLAEGVAPHAIVVVHNPVSPQDPQLLPPDDAIEVLRGDHNLGYAAGMNRGIARQRERGCDPIVLFTHDVRLRAGALRQLLDASRRHARHAVVAPVLMWPGTDEPFSYGGLTRTDGTNGHIRDPAAPGTDGLLACDWVDGSAMVLRRDALDQLVGFDERFFGYCEEADLCLRARRAGWRIAVVRDAVAEQAPAVRKRPGAWRYLLTRNSMEYARRAAGARGVIATLRRALRSTAYLGVRVLARSSGLRPGPAREPWVELVAVVRGTVDFLRRRWGPPPANLPGLGDMRFVERSSDRR